MYTLYMAKLAARRAWMAAQTRDNKAWLAYKVAEERRSRVLAYSGKDVPLYHLALKQAGRVADHTQRQVTEAWRRYQAASSAYHFALEALTGCECPSCQVLAVFP